MDEHGEDLAGRWPWVVVDAEVVAVGERGEIDVLELRVLGDGERVRHVG
jgi:hypothetical protein